MFSRFLCFAIVASLTACTGGLGPIDGRKVLEGTDGPAISGIAATQMTAAETAEKNGDFRQAESIYRQLADQSPENNAFKTALGDILRRQGRFDEALAVYEAVLAKQPGDLSAKEGKGLALMSKGDFENTPALFAEIMQADATRWKTLNALGILFSTRHMYSEALQYFAEARRFNANNAAVLNNTGLVQALDKQLPNAIQSLKEAATLATLEREKKRIDLNLALVYGVSGQMNEAKALAERHLSGAELANNLGIYAHLAKDDALAQQYLNEALAESKSYYGKAWENREALKDTPALKEPSGNVLKLPAIPKK